jgi:hypothetical protein
VAKVYICAWFMIGVFGVCKPWLFRLRSFRCILKSSALERMLSVPLLALLTERWSGSVTGQRSKLLFFALRAAQFSNS